MKETIESSWRSSYVNLFVELEYFDLNRSLLLIFSSGAFHGSEMSDEGFLKFVACSLICNIARNNVLPVRDSSSLENNKDIPDTT